MDLVHPFLRRMMRRVRGAGHVVAEERLARVNLVDPVHPIDGVVGHAGDEVPARLALEGIDLGRVAEQVRLPLVRVAADEPVEILEAHAGRPLVERPDRAGLEGRRVVVLAEPGGGEAIVQQDAADGRLVLGDDAVVAREAGGLLGDHAEASRVMIAAGDQRSARRRTERGGIDLGVAQPVLRDAIHGRRRDDTAVGAGHGEAGVVGHDEQDVGRALGRHDARRPPRFRLEGVVLDHAAEFRIGRRELFPVNGRGGAGRTRLAGGLLQRQPANRQSRQMQRLQSTGGFVFFYSWFSPHHYFLLAFHNLSRCEPIPAPTMPGLFCTKAPPKDFQLKSSISGPRYPQRRYLTHLLVSDDFTPR